MAKPPVRASSPPAQHWGPQQPGEGRAHLEGGAERGRRAGGLQAGGRGAVRLVDGLRLGALNVAAVPDQYVRRRAGVQIVLVHPVGPLRAKHGKHERSSGRP